MDDSLSRRRFNWPIRRPEHPTPFLRSAAILAVPIVLLMTVLLGIVLYREYDSRQEADRLDAYWAQFIADAERGGGFREAQGGDYVCAEAEKVSRGESSFIFSEELHLSREQATELRAFV